MREIKMVVGRAFGRGRIRRRVQEVNDWRTWDSSDRGYPGSGKSTLARASVMYSIPRISRLIG